MSFEITITKDLKFSINPEEWAVSKTSPEGPRITQRHKNGPGATWWSVQIRKSTGRVYCYAHKRASVGPSGTKQLDDCTARWFKLRPGIITLSDLTSGNLYEAKANFRSPYFQDFLSRYRLYAIRHCSLNGKRLPNMARDDGGTKVYTIYVRTDGELVYNAKKDAYEFRDCTWVLEERVRYDAQGNLLEDGYILYTRIRSLEQLERIFLENRVFQEYSWVPSHKKRN